MGGSDPREPWGVAPSEEYSRLLGLQRRLLDELQEVRDELGSPATMELIRAVKNRQGSMAGESLGDVLTAVEQALRALKVAGSDMEAELQEDPLEISVEGVPNLPASLARFLAERAESPGFRYEVGQDAVRGWMIRWKEYTAQGTVRGHGQFYERPYAWLDD